MHYSTCAVILAAGSSIASAATPMKELFDIPSISRRAAFLDASAAKPKTPAANPKTPVALGKTADKPAAKNAPQPSNSNAKTSLLKNTISQNSANRGVASLGMTKSMKTPVSQPAVNTDDADAAQIRRAAKQAAIYMDAYQQYHPPKKGQSLADDMPPPMNFQFSNNYGSQTTYQGAVTNTNTDNRQYAAAGASIASGGSTAKTDNSMTDNSQKSFGGGISGNTGSTRNSRRSLDDTYEVKEDGRVVYRDFVLLVKAMKRDYAAKEQVLYEIAGVPGFRSLVENLIQQYTDTNGELTMDNFAALVDAMTKDKATEVDVVKAFNSNLVYAALIEKLLVKYYVPEDQGLSSSKKEKRDFDNELFSLTIRGIEDDYLQMEARDFYEEYYWLAARGLDDETSELLVRDLEAYMGYDPELFY